MPKTNPPENETKAEKFHRVVNPRAKTVKKYLGLIEGMIKQPAYETTPEDLEKLRAYIQESVDSLNATIDKAIRGGGSTKADIEDVF